MLDPKHWSRRRQAISIRSPLRIPTASGALLRHKMEYPHDHSDHLHHLVSIYGISINTYYTIYIYDNSNNNSDNNDSNDMKNMMSAVMWLKAMP